ncbi:MAG: hypothetical protein NTZ69_07525 [Bacteroidia bacterium]|nr:hypothetical protein [Bacteroidia bacterium]
MSKSIYFETLRLGFENTNGISFNEVVERLNIDLSNITFETNYAIWFYSNFYNGNIESLIVAQGIATNSDFRINERNLETRVRKHNSEKSFIKGDAINKYIDFLELERTRKSSTTATVISLISVAIAISSIVIPIMYNHNPQPPYEVIITNDRNNTANSKFDNSLDCKSGFKDVNNNKTGSTDTLDVVKPK